MSTENPAMTQKFTAEEVREWVAIAEGQAKLYAGMKGAHEPWTKLSAMLTAYANRIEADESAVPLAWLEAEPSASLESLQSEFGMFVHSMQFHVGKSRPANRPALNKLFPLFTYPPAQAAQVDVDAWRDAAADVLGESSNLYRMLCQQAKEYASSAPPASPAGVPDTRTEMDYEYDAEGLLDPYDSGHMAGWNDCRKVMLAAPSATPEFTTPDCPNCGCVDDGQCLCPCKGE